MKIKYLFWRKNIFGELRRTFLGIKSDDITWKRPASGISPKFIEKVIGKKAAKLILEDESIQWDMIS